MQENLIFIGILLIFVGILLIFLGAILSSKEVKTEWGFFGLIGPIPFGAWSSKRVFALTIILFIILVIILSLMKVIKWL
ncbi:MAG: TIGR00304 family protein [Candidatus Aenigmatarchaeota archaeon]